MKQFRIHTNDLVEVLAGKNKGKKSRFSEKSAQSCIFDYRHNRQQNKRPHGQSHQPRWGIFRRPSVTVTTGL